MHIQELIARLRRRVLGATVGPDSPKLDRTAEFVVRSGEPFPSFDTQGGMAAIFRDYKGPLVDKWEHYLPLYDRYFAPSLANALSDGRGLRALRFLEIGVF